MAKYKVTIDDRVYEVIVEPMEEGAEASSGTTPPSEEEAPAKETKETKEMEGHKVTAPLSGTIVSTKVKVGDQVEEGDVLLTLEALKLENEISAPVAGTVVDIATEGDPVETGETIAVIE